MKKNHVLQKQVSHSEKCSQLSAKLAQLYLDQGVISDGGIINAFIEMCEGEMAEAVILDATVLLKAFTKIYQRNKNAATEINKVFEQQDLFNRNQTVLQRLKGIERFFDLIFNFTSPGFIEMKRLTQNPDFYSTDDLEYIKDKFLDLTHA